MSINSTGRMVRDKILSILKDDTYGWNAQIAALSSDSDWEGLSPTDSLWQPIDFSNPAQFRETSVPIEDLVTEDGIRFPFITLYSPSSSNQNENRTRGLLYTADTLATLSVVISWKSSRLENTELRGDLIEHLFINLFHRQSVWNGSVSFNGDSSFQRSPIATGAENWQQGFVASLSLFVDA